MPILNKNRRRLDINGFSKVHVQNVSKYYGTVAALDNVNFSVNSGEFLTLLGPSGSGKTTLLMVLAGFADLSSGQICIDSQDITNTPPENRQFGIVFQGYALFPHMTVFENIAYPLKLRGVPKAEVHQKVQKVLELVQLDALANRYPKQLSGGQQQRTALGRTLVYDPLIILLDESLGALDKKLRSELQQELKALHGQLGRTFVNVTHDQDEALDMSDRVVVMNEGRVEQIGTPREIYERPVSRFVVEFLGDSNLLPMSLAFGGVEDETRSAMLRPEAISIRAENAKPSLGDDQFLKGTVQNVSYFGADQLVEIALDGTGQAIRARVPSTGTVSLLPGGSVTVGWDRRNLHVVENQSAS